MQLYPSSNSISIINGYLKYNFIQPLLTIIEERKEYFNNLGKASEILSEANN
jgi:hypothetical protein